MNTHLYYFPFLFILAPSRHQKGPNKTKNKIKPEEGQESMQERDAGVKQMIVHISENLFVFILRLISLERES